MRTIFQLAFIQFCLSNFFEWSPSNEEKREKKSTFGFFAKIIYSKQVIFFVEFFGIYSRADYTFSSKRTKFKIATKVCQAFLFKNYYFSKLVEILAPNFSIEKNSMILLNYFFPKIFTKIWGIWKFRKSLVKINTFLNCTILYADLKWKQSIRYFGSFLFCVFRLFLADFRCLLLIRKICDFSYQDWINENLLTSTNWRA
jgi:hypothetical protein